MYKRCLLKVTWACFVTPWLVCPVVYMLMLPPLDTRQCDTESAQTETILSILIVIGLVVSYIPQHYRIVSSGSSDGFSPWFLLLGTTSSTSSFLNVLLLQVDVIRCCQIQIFSQCLINALGIMQIGFQWLMFSILFILFLVYFPASRKYTHYIATFTNVQKTRRVTSPEWRSSIAIAYIVMAHLVLCSALSVLFLYRTSGPGRDEMRWWAGFLGLCSMVLALFQYLPQIYTTYSRKTVGALSIPMMCLQTPGSFVFVYTLAIRPGVNPTTWLTFLITGLLQGTLLVLCIIYKLRARRLGIDDFQSTPAVPDAERSNVADENTPLLE